MTTIIYVIITAIVFSEIIYLKIVDQTYVIKLNQKATVRIFTSLQSPICIFSSVIQISEKSVPHLLS